MIDVSSFVIVFWSFCCSVDARDFGFEVGECGGWVDGFLLKEERDCWVGFEKGLRGLHCWVVVN
jgi:hypothetical protein